MAVSVVVLILANVGSDAGLGVVYSGGCPIWEGLSMVVDIIGGETTTQRSGAVSVGHWLYEEEEDEEERGENTWGGLAA